MLAILACLDSSGKCAETCAMCAQTFTIAIRGQQHLSLQKAHSINMWAAMSHWQRNKGKLTILLEKRPNWSCCISLAPLQGCSALVAVQLRSVWATRRSHRQWAPGLGHLPRVRSERPSPCGSP